VELLLRVIVACRICPILVIISAFTLLSCFFFVGF
jgi:hypothetical protein